MKLIKYTTGFVLMIFLLNGCGSKPATVRVSSPDAGLHFLFGLNDSGTPEYAVLKGADTVIRQSALGLTTAAGAFGQALGLTEIGAPQQVSDSYTLHHGKQRDFAYTATEQRFVLENTGGQVLEVVVRVFNDGVAFRYRLPELGQTQVVEEHTTFGFDAETRMWIQPMAVAKTGWNRTNPSYEEDYEQGIPLTQTSTMGAGWVYPALFKTGENWVLISETAMGADDCGTRLETDTSNYSMKVQFPPAVEEFPGRGVLPVVNGTWESPWRILAIGSLAEVVESTLGTDLADPAISMDASFVKPGASSWSWVLLKDAFTIYEVQKEFVDYAADMQWPYTLVDADWDTTIGYERIADLSAYAQTKGVGLLLWYNSAGSWNDVPYHPKDKLLTEESRAAEFSRLRDMGIKGVKIDFFGGDGQSMMAYYHDILKDAAKYQLLVNFHGATLPRGWQRTYPHLMTMESVKGMEFITFTQDNADRAPTHCAMLPFTRNVWDPMDFTPMAFSELTGIQRRTSNAFELALPVLFQSGVQHMAEIPEGMAAVPDDVKELLRGFPTAWDETRLIAGFPGKDVIMARRAGSVWYVAGINGEPLEKQMQLNLDFLAGAKGFSISDGLTNRSFAKADVTIGADGRWPVTLAANGGFLMKVSL